MASHYVNRYWPRFREQNGVWCQYTRLVPGPLFTQPRTSYHGNLTARSREDSKPRDSGLDFSNRSEIWEAPRQYRSRDACPIAEQYDHYDTQSRGFETHEMWWETSYCLVNRGERANVGEHGVFWRQWYTSTDYWCMATTWKALRNVSFNQNMYLCIWLQFLSNP